MVFNGNLSPDPSNRPDENFLPSEVTSFVLTSSDSEEDEGMYEGYEVLPQDSVENTTFQSDDNDSQRGSSDGSSEINVFPTNDKEVSHFDEGTKSEVSALWNSAHSSRLSDIVMDSAKEEEIKSAMAGFKLPSNAIPPWAKQIPEEEWKEQLINKVNLMRKVTTV